MLVSAHTNVAVDRILMGLIDSGMTDLIRVGSLSKISKSVLKYSLHCSDLDGRTSSNGVEEIKKMLKECTNRDEAAILKCAFSNCIPLFRIYCTPSEEGIPMRTLSS